VCEGWRDYQEGDWTSAMLGSRSKSQLNTELDLPGSESGARGSQPSE
jgi:hypothetical protein